MQLVINGKPVEIAPVATLKELITVKNLPELQVVLELNGELIPRDNWGQTSVQAGDTIEILRFVGGG
jgi:thiamine biosynthesis protein ThiS